MHEDVAVVVEAMLDGVWGVMGVEGSGLLGVRGRIQRRGLVIGSADVGGKAGDTTVLEAGSEAEDDEEEPELSEAREQLVPLRTSCRNPATGDVKRDGEAKPDVEHSGVCGGEIGVAQGRPCGS